MSIGALYKRALEAAAAGEATVYNYSDEGDFATLWGTSRPPLGVPSLLSEWTTGTPALVVVWDGNLPIAVPSADDRLLFKHLTPLDWALAFSSRVFETDDLKTRAPFAIVIVDLTSQREMDLWSTRMRCQLLADMPWVTLCAPIPCLVDAGTRAGLHICLPILPTAKGLAQEQTNDSQAHDPAQLLTSIGDGKWKILDSATKTSLASVSADGRSVRLRSLGRQWAASLAQVDEHHVLNNVIGPYVIADLVGIARPEAGRTNQHLVEAFLARLNWSALIGPRDKGNQVNPDRNDDETHQLEGDLDILAVDDRLDIWQNVLAFLVGAQSTTTRPNEQIQRIGLSSQLQLFGTTDPNALLDPLGISSITDNGAKIDLNRYKKRQFDSPVAGSEERPWALVLDLRLFAGKPDRAHAWYLTLARAAKALCAVEAELPWAGFSSDLPNLERWIDQDCSNRLDPRSPLEQPLALSLLARLCALRWPCTPIILFSSTARREVIEKLAPYGNIFLAGAKPGLLDADPVAKLKGFLHSWRTEFAASQHLVSVQRRILDLFSTNDNIGVPAVGGGHFHVTIALDESGDFAAVKKSVIGGICLIVKGNNESEAIANTFEFSEALRKEGVNFYDFPPHYADLPTPKSGLSYSTIIPKKEPIGDKVVAVYQRFKSKLEIGLVRHAIRKSDYVEGGTIHHAAYLSSMARLLNLILVEMLPSLGMNIGVNCTLAIWLPVKQTTHIDEEQVKAAGRVAMADARANGLSNSEIEDARRKALTADQDRQTPQGIILATKFANTYDLRLTRPGGYQVETIGGFGNALSQLSRAVGKRTEYPRIFGAIRCLRARKLPYWKDQYYRYQRATNWVCMKSGCGALFTLFSMQDTTCPRCSAPARVADYTVLAHVADALLSPDDFPLDDHVKPALSDQLSFDCEHDRQLIDFMNVSQLWDEKSLADGFPLAYRSGFFLNGIGKKSEIRAQLHFRLVKLFAEYATSVNGATLTELSGLRPRGLARPTALDANTPARSVSVHHGDSKPAKGVGLPQVQYDVPSKSIVSTPTDPIADEWIVFTQSKYEPSAGTPTEYVKRLVSNLGLSDLIWIDPPQRTKTGNLRLSVSTAVLQPYMLAELRKLIGLNRVALSMGLVAAVNRISHGADSSSQPNGRARSAPVSSQAQGAAVAFGNLALSAASHAVSVRSEPSREDASRQASGDFSSHGKSARLDGRLDSGGKRPSAPTLHAAAGDSGKAQSEASENPEHGSLSNSLESRSRIETAFLEPLATGRILRTHLFKSSRRHGYLVEVELAEWGKVTCFANCLPISGVDTGALVALKSVPTRGGDRCTIKGGTIAYAIEISHVSVKTGEWFRLHEAQAS